MATVKIEEDEMWPWFIIHDGDCAYGESYEVDDATLAHWRQVQSDASKVQDEIRKLVKWND